MNAPRFADMATRDLHELALRNDPTETAKAMRTYTESLEPQELANLTALAELNTADKLVQMALDADVQGKPHAAIFTMWASIIRRAKDAMSRASGNTAAGVVDVASPLAPYATHSPGEPWALPVVSLTADQQVYELVSKLQKGRPVRHTKTSGWAVLGGKPSENLYVEDAVVKRAFENGIIVPNVGEPWSMEAKEFNLSAVGWRGMGCLYTDRTAAAELRVYEVAGTKADTPEAKKHRSVTAEYRMRQARRDVTPGWNRYGEFTLTLTEKETGDAVKTVTVVFESGRPSNPDAFEFYSDALLNGYHQHIQGQGATVGKTVEQRARELIVPLVKLFCEEQRADARSRKPKKPPAPPLTVLDEGDDADALARELGIL